MISKSIAAIASVGLIGTLVWGTQLQTPMPPYPTVEGKTGEVIPIPVSNADLDTKFECWPESDRWYPTQRWGTNECVLLFFPDRAGKYAFFVANHTEERGTSLDRIVVNVSGPTPPPPPIPPPNPDLTGLAKAAFDNAQRVPAAARSKAPELAEAYRGVSAMIAAGVLKDSFKILDATRSATGQALGSSVSGWQEWNVAMEGEFRRAGLRTPEDIRVAWEQVANGLSAVRG